MMKNLFIYDCHCHVHEGSLDSLVKVKEYVEKLIEKGFSGCIITDHNSFKGYEYYVDNLKDKYKDFYVFKGIEYDTTDAGHMLVIMPSAYKSNLLETRGLKLEELIEYVHKHKGIIGPAHPFYEPFLAIFKTGKYQKCFDICKKFDFLEGYNATEKEECNGKARQLAKQYGIPSLGGSDAHNIETCGLGYTVFKEKIKEVDELIKYIKDKRKTIALGTRYCKTTREKLGKYNKILVYGFYPYNKFLALLKKRKLSHIIKNERNNFQF